ncbi:Oxygen-dependent choline dehydrogenase [Pleurostoma richardsiae]|uniref:Oxygen-dependent choline dehydrogenase n=1 Tax=Pleurostoma richardsiae TaxID=41990 RepID=A0AA38RDN4_9PEZI|nr:Oxygen-dependent choline dehydrogenase [Pleurostoma richardsiae]
MQWSLFIVSVALSIAEPCTASLPRGVHRSRILSHPVNVDNVYDYVIVGGGTAGLTIADRLTEDGKTTVLVIEYGELSDSPLISTVQGGFQGMNSKFLYPILSVPQVNLHNLTVGVLAGRVVGGSSAVNAMMTVRGTTEDYDRWGQFFSNCSSWSWDGLLPYFKKGLHFAPPNQDVAEAANITYDMSFWGNTSGVYAGWPSYQFPGTKLQLDAFREIPGVEYPPDSGAGMTGVYWFPTFMDPKTVTRSYARTGHYSNLNRTNYHLITGSKVNKIMLNGTTATGVRFVSWPGTPANSTLWSNSTSNSTRTVTTVRARKEVILSAGGIHSPQIMQLSGLGPRRLLASANITVNVDLPGVGQNFQDHPMLTAAIILRNFTVHPSSFDIFTNATFRSWANKVWAANKTGPYSIAIGNAAAWLSFPVISPRYEDIAAKLSSSNVSEYLPPDTHPTVVAGYRAQMRALAAALRSNDTAFYNNVISGGPGAGTLVDLHPLSRGTVNINIIDPEGSEPVVDYRALSNPVDTMIMVDMLRFTRRYYFNTTINTQFAPVELQPGDCVTSEEDLAGYLSETLSPTKYHPAGTCAMLPRELGGVVDEELRVYGVQKLRIADASIMPTLPGANTCQTVYAIAEKAADLIRGSALPD